MHKKKHSYAYRLLQIVTVLLLAFSPSSAQMTALSTEFQIYPTGIIPGIHMDRTVGSQSMVHLRLGYQIIDHRDLGVQDDETGSGYGFTLGFSRFFKEGFDKWHWGIRNDIWFNTIDWQNNNPSASGTTKITVVQPTAHLGYLHTFSSDWFVAPTAAFGFEVNVKTQGEPTGEGAILLFGVRLGKWL